MGFFRLGFLHDRDYVSTSYNYFKATKYYKVYKGYTISWTGVSLEDDGKWSNVSFIGGDGPDTYAFTNKVDNTIDGGRGDDEILFSYYGKGAASIHGGGGDDFITSGSNNSTIYGDDGNDRLLIVGGSTASRVYGGSGNDSISMSYGEGYGGDDNDTMSIFSGTLYGEAGSDFLQSSGGHSSLVGESGNDTLIAEGGDNTLIGGYKGDNSIHGGTGFDKIYSMGAHDTVYGDLGADEIHVGQPLHKGGGYTTFVYKHMGDSLDWEHDQIWADQGLIDLTELNRNLSAPGSLHWWNNQASDKFYAIHTDPSIGSRTLWFVGYDTDHVYKKFEIVGMNMTGWVFNVKF